MLFFFKQKTAYEMRISDWSSDVCSSDLTIIGYRSRMAGKITAHIDPISTKPERRVGIHSQGGVVTDIDQEIKYEREGEDFDFTKPITINGHLYAPVGPMTPGAALGLGKLPREMVAAEPDPQI